MRIQISDILFQGKWTLVKIWIGMFMSFLFGLEIRQYFIFLVFREISITFCGSENQYHLWVDIGNKWLHPYFGYKIKLCPTEFIEILL